MFGDCTGGDRDEFHINFAVDPATLLGAVDELVLEPAYGRRE